MPESDVGEKGQRGIKGEAFLPSVLKYRSSLCCQEKDKTFVIVLGLNFQTGQN